MDGPGSQSQTPAQAPKTCPSAPPEVGSVLLGVVTAPGQVAYLNPHPPVTPRLLEALAGKGAPVENRVRFACQCAEGGCVQWKDEAGSGRCGLIDHALEALAITEAPRTLPRCGIRNTCRWYAQHGANACGACPEVIRRPERD
ncbi:MAG: hypothetical protein P4L64_00670 [Caulobacteraceae bacterium]|nr:hypothetical protein [Caulobacteraceae bacterium]